MFLVSNPSLSVPAQFCLAAVDGSGQRADSDDFLTAGKFGVHMFADAHPATPTVEDSSPEAVWQVEAEDWTAGGVVPFGAPVRLRHLLSSRYLASAPVRGRALPPLPGAFCAPIPLSLRTLHAFGRWTFVAAAFRTCLLRPL